VLVFVINGPARGALAGMCDRLGHLRPCDLRPENLVVLNVKFMDLYI
jgi:hypothetical protein